LIEILKEDDVWEALHLLNGDTFIYCKGFKEEAPVQDVFKCVSGKSSQFICLDTDLLSPIKDSMIRLNRAAIAFAWYIDPDSDIIRELKRYMSEQEG
jgi:hypothetical protein